jgi:hypothetical protein
MISKTVPPAPLSRPKLNKPLFVCGSASGVLAEQRDMLARHTGFAQAVLDPEILALPEAVGRRKQLAEGLAATWLAGGLILCIAPLSQTGPRAMPDRVVQGLAEVTASLIMQSSPDGLFLSGGDTAESVWRQIGAEAILLIEEILPGVMRGELVGGRLNGLPVVRFTAANPSFINNNTNYAAPVTVIYVARMTGGADFRLVSSNGGNWLLGYWGGRRDQAYRRKPHHRAEARREEYVG